VPRPCRRLLVTYALASDAVTLRGILDQKNLVDSYDSQIKSRQPEVDSINKDEARLRENMKALKGIPEEKALLQRYTKQLDSQEDRLNALQKEIADLNPKRNKADEDLDQMVQSAALDESF
jgi:predicted  nucleic acid-binding Zn-ribbon protein